jgi:hypothetical protein
MSSLHFGESSAMNSKTLLTLFVALTGIAAAQAPQPVQIFGGYSLAHIAPCGTAGGSCGFEGTSFQGSISPKTGNFNGWNAAATYFFAHGMGITADFAGYYGNVSYTSASATSSSTYTMLFGPTWAGKFGRVTIFSNFLFGAESFHLSFTSGSGFATAFGGGVDYSLQKNVKLRLAQFDYLVSHQPASQNSTWSGGFRYSGGLVFSF